MSLSDYFANATGTGVLATADGEGNVNAAIYARPHVHEDGTVAFLMRDRLSHANLQSNGHAAFLFIEDGGGYKGKRLSLTKVAETDDADEIAALCSSRCPCEDADKGTRFLVSFRVDRELPLIGAGT